MPRKKNKDLKSEKTTNRSKKTVSTHTDKVILTKEKKIDAA